MHYLVENNKMKNGYEIIDKKNNKYLEQLNLLVKKLIKKKHPSFSSELSELHKFVSLKEVNALRLYIFNYINNRFKWEMNISKLCGDDLKNYLGQDILVQSKINLSIQMPNDKSSILSAHSDCWSSDSPFQLNLWIPLTNAYESNSMFIWSKKQSLNLMKKISNDDFYQLSPSRLKASKDQFIKIFFGEILLFNPALIHGNILNKTNQTRISLNLRFKSLFSPEPTKKNPDRKFGTYYKKFCLSENTRFAVQMIESGIFNEDN